MQKSPLSISKRHCKKGNHDKKKRWQRGFLNLMQKAWSAYRRRTKVRQRGRARLKKTHKNKEIRRVFLDGFQHFVINCYKFWWNWVALFARLLFCAKWDSPFSFLLFVCLFARKRKFGLCRAFNKRIVYRNNLSWRVDIPACLRVAFQINRHG